MKQLFADDGYTRDETTDCTGCRESSSKYKIRNINPDFKKKNKILHGTPT